MKPVEWLKDNVPAYHAFKTQRGAKMVVLMLITAAIFSPESNVLAENDGAELHIIPKLIVMSKEEELHTFKRNNHQVPYSTLWILYL